jgi:ring-1,2-phenylacetyl-CoA epoxidase subunit PaaC
MQQKEAIKDLLYRLADDDLILGHRNSEWTGIGPILEEDIAFSSMAQDKLGYAQAYYTLLNEMGEADPDNLAFNRGDSGDSNESLYKCCHFVEYPIGEYDFSLMRHFLFDYAEAIRMEMLINSSFEPLANLAKKFRGEVRYHIMHAHTWIKQLGHGNEESKARMQSALNECMPLALGIFEPSEYENTLIEAGIFPGEEKLKQVWLEQITPVIAEAGLEMPDLNSIEPAYGGRKGFHTEYLKPLLDEMTEVYRIDPSAEW